MQLLKTGPLGTATPVLCFFFFYHLYLPFHRLSLLGMIVKKKKKNKKMKNEKEMFP